MASGPDLIARHQDNVTCIFEARAKDPGLKKMWVHINTGHMIKELPEFAVRSKWRCFKLKLNEKKIIEFQVISKKNDIDSSIRYMINKTMYFLNAKYKINVKTYPEVSSSITPQKIEVIPIIKDDKIEIKKRKDESKEESKEEFKEEKYEIITPTFSDLKKSEKFLLPKLLQTEHQYNHFRDVKLLNMLRSKELTYKIINYIEHHRKIWQKEVLKTKRNLYIRSSIYLPRSVQYNTDNSIFIHFTKGSSGDKLLGYGSSKIVKLAMNYANGELFASAGIDNPLDQEPEKAEIVKNLKGFVQLLYVVRYADKRGEILKTRIILKLYGRGDLRKIIRSQELTSELKKKIVRQLLEAILRLHQKGLLHRDINARNVFLTSGDKIHAHIGDLSSICYANSGLICAEHRTTCWYAPPEYAKAFLKDFAEKSVIDDYLLPSLEKATTYKLDVWSLGCLFYEMYYKKRMPWAIDEHQLDVFKRVASLEVDWWPEPKMKSSIFHLIWEMLRVNPKDRISIEEAYRKFALITKLKHSIV